MVSVILDSVAARFSIFDPSMKFIDGLASDREGGARTSNFSKDTALRNLSIAFGLRVTTPSGVRSTPFTRAAGGGLPYCIGIKLRSVYDISILIPSKGKA